eukprot:212144_1
MTSQLIAREEAILKREHLNQIYKSLESRFESKLVELKSISSQQKSESKRQKQKESELMAKEERLYAVERELHCKQNEQLQSVVESLEIQKQNKLRFVVRRRHFEAKRREIQDKLKAKSHALTEYKKGIVKYEEQNKIRGKGEEIDG